MRSKVRPGAERPYRRPRGPAAADIETHVMPKTCYLAGDRVRPRWRFCLVMINNTREDCRVQAVCIVQTSTRQTAQRTLSGNALKEMFAQGSPEVAAGKGVVLDVQEPPDTHVAPRSVRVVVRLATRSGRELVLCRRVALKRARTQGLRFPLDGAWVAANARPDLHCVGTQFGFDFVRREDMRHHDHPPPRKMRLAEFASFGRTVRAPIGGAVVASEANQEDFPPTLSDVTFPNGPPKGKRKMAYIGNYVAIQMGSGACALLVHFRQATVRVRAGEQVVEGMIIGEVGNSGNTSGPHLHMEVLDSVPNLADLFTLDFGQSGIPFGFHSVKLHGNRHENRSRRIVVPSKGDALSRIRSLGQG